MVLSSPLYSNEFTFHCDKDDNSFSMIFDINRTEKSVVFSHSIDKTNNSVFELNQLMEIYHWDEENDSVWLTLYQNRKPAFLPIMSVFLLDFVHQKLKVQSLKLLLPPFGEYNKDFTNSRYDCYTLG
jgi:hypothetical protein